MKIRLLHLIFCAFRLAEVQSQISNCDFLHTDGRIEAEFDSKKCFCGPEKIPQYNKNDNGELTGPNSNSLNFQRELFTALSTFCLFETEFKAKKLFSRN